MPFKFENLKVWQLSLDLADKIHLFTRTFPKEEKLFILTLKLVNQNIQALRNSLN
ncbi:MAG: four helix bundle protein [Chitinophagaceae bacterium]